MYTTYHTEKCDLCPVSGMVGSVAFPPVLVSSAGKWEHTATSFIPVCGFPPERIRATKRTAVWVGFNPKKCTKNLKLKACHRTYFSLGSCDSMPILHTFLMWE